MRGTTVKLLRRATTKAVQGMQLPPQEKNRMFYRTYKALKAWWSALNHGQRGRQRRKLSRGVEGT